jgi:hypothetical protein
MKANVAIRSDDDLRHQEHHPAEKHHAVRVHDHGNRQRSAHNR